MSLTIYVYTYILIEASRGIGAQSVTENKTGCGYYSHSRKLINYINLFFYLFALVPRQNTTISSATQHAMLPESSGKWETECLNTRSSAYSAVRRIQREAVFCASAPDLSLSTHTKHVNIGLQFIKFVQYYIIIL